MAFAFLLTTAVSKATQCSSGDEYPSDNTPSNVKSLLQTKLQINVLGDGSSMMKSPNAMLTELEGMIHSGEKPAFALISMIKNLIQDDISPVLQATRDAAAEDTTDALRAIQLCNSQSKTKEGKIERSEQVLVDEARSNHTACREAEMVLYFHIHPGSLSFAQGISASDDHDSCCPQLEEFLEQTKSVSLDIPDGSTREQAVEYVKDASNSNLCAVSKVTELENCCKSDEKALADKKVECDMKQESFELAFCTWKDELESNVEVLDTCYSKAVTAYINHISKTQTLVLEKWNIETEALQKILCYCNVWLSELDDRDNRSSHDANQFDVCKNQTHTHAPVNYGTPEAKVALDVTSVANHPGTSGFITQEYHSFITQGYISVAEVTPCTAP